VWKALTLATTLLQAMVHLGRGDRRNVPLHPALEHASEGIAEKSVSDLKNDLGHLRGIVAKACARGSDASVNHPAVDRMPFVTVMSPISPNLRLKRPRNSHRICLVAISVWFQMDPNGRGANLFAVIE
jgi:hypothetical protein